MPTPFQHLTYAKTLLDTPRLPDSLRQRLRANLGAFMLGNTAVDVQAVSGQRRFETHFYHLPPARVPRAWQVLLKQNPSLADPCALTPDHAAFVSGYFAHLIYDEIWAWEVFVPFYMNADLWPDRLTRIVHHNALRVLLDRRTMPELCAWPELETLLRAVEPAGWLLFAPDAALCHWRDWVAGQVADPEHAETPSVFAERMGVTVAHLEDVVQQIATDTYPLPMPGLWDAVARFEAQAQDETVDVLVEYWGEV